MCHLKDLCFWTGCWYEGDTSFQNSQLPKTAFTLNTQWSVITSNTQSVKSTISIHSPTSKRRTQSNLATEQFCKSEKPMHLSKTSFICNKQTRAQVQTCNLAKLERVRKSSKVAKLQVQVFRLSGETHISSEEKQKQLEAALGHSAGWSIEQTPELMH